MDGQRAEAHLRLLAEEELRRPASAWGERRIRVGRVAELLTAIGALDSEVAGRIMADFGAALAARQADARYRRVLAGRSLRWPDDVRSGPAMPVSPGPPGSGPVPGRVVRLGQVIPVRGGPGGEVYLLSYAQTGPGHQLSLFVRSTGQDGPAGPEAGILEQFTATDDRGTRYQMRVRDLGGGTDGWTLLLEPGPPHDPRWLDLITAPGQPAVRVDLDSSARPRQDATVTAGPVTASPGDHMLHAVAAALLAKDDRLGFPPRHSAPRPRTLAPDAEWFGDIIAALEAAGALSRSAWYPDHPGNPRPAQLPGPHRRAHARQRPDEPGELPGGLTVLLAGDLDPRQRRALAATRTLGSSSPNAGGSALRMEMVPPLSRATTGIEVIATGRSAQARARLPLRWQ